MKCGTLFTVRGILSRMLGRLLHNGHLLRCGPRNGRTKTGSPEAEQAG